MPFGKSDANSGNNGLFGKTVSSMGFLGKKFDIFDVKNVPHLRFGGQPMVNPIRASEPPTLMN